MAGKYGFSTARKMLSKYPGTCYRCEQTIAVGETIIYDGREPFTGRAFTWHEACFTPARKVVEAKRKPAAAAPATKAAVQPIAEREYGVGRVPADVDATSEALADLDAAETMATMMRRGSAASSRCSYRGCRQPGTMTTSHGLACPDHYDDLSG